MNYIIKKQFLALSMASLVMSCTPSDMAKRAFDHNATKPISGDFAAKNYSNLHQRMVILDGYIGKVCETLGKNGCEDTLEKSRFVIYGNSIDNSKENFNLCYLGEGEEILLDGYFSSKFGINEGTRVLLSGNIIFMPTELPIDKKSKRRVLVKKRYMYILQNVKILDIMDEKCN